MNNNSITTDARIYFTPVHLTSSNICQGFSIQTLTLMKLHKCIINPFLANPSPPFSPFQPPQTPQVVGLISATSSRQAELSWAARRCTILTKVREEGLFLLPGLLSRFLVNAWQRTRIFPLRNVRKKHHALCISVAQNGPWWKKGFWLMVSIVKDRKYISRKRGWLFFVCKRCSHYSQTHTQTRQILFMLPTGRL